MDMDVLSLIVSIASLGFSFWSLLISRGVLPTLYKSGIDITINGDAFDFLFSEKEQCRNEQSVKLVNKNNRDILVFLRSGYICNDNKKYYLKSEYYKLLANDVTTIQVKVDIGKIDELQEKDYKYMFEFECPGLFFSRKKICKEKR